MIPVELAETLTAPLSEAERAVVAGTYEYLDLCTEQVFLRMQGRIRRRTWVDWRSGIEANLGKQPLGDSWIIVRTKFPDEFHELRLLEESDYSDPRGWSALWRRWLRRELPAADRRVRRRALRYARHGAVIPLRSPATPELPSPDPTDAESPLSRGRGPDGSRKSKA
jgi:hypothetical protein